MNTSWCWLCEKLSSLSFRERQCITAASSYLKWYDAILIKLVSFGSLICGMERCRINYINSVTEDLINVSDWILTSILLENYKAQIWNKGIDGIYVRPGKTIWKVNEPDDWSHIYVYFYTTYIQLYRLDFVLYQSMRWFESSSTIFA